MSSGKVIVVAGATAAGKSELALQLATSFHSRIVCCDAVQVFRDADIGSAKLPIEQRRGIEHLGLDLLSCAERIDAGAFSRQITALLSGYDQEGPPILCIGTTMYYSALMYGLADIQKIDQAVRDELEQLSSEVLHAQLLDLDPQRARNLHQNDRMRIIRALEILRTKDQAASDLYKQQETKALANPLVLLLCWTREQLYERINRRTAELLQAGLLEETEKLLQQYGPEAQVLTAIGYKECVDVLLGRAPSVNLVETIAQNTRRFAKKQLTFWRREAERRGLHSQPLQSGEHSISSATRKRNVKEFTALEYGPDELMRNVRLWLSGEAEPSIWYCDAGRLFASTSR